MLRVPLMIVNDDEIFARPLAQNFLHQFLREQDARPGV